jgi:glyoxylase-like metal-dependent hydrolase (beta-lactamase superfamily II)
MTTVTPVLGNSQKLDGGAMFGNAPRAMWEHWVTPDELHRIPLATRGLLVREDTGRNVLLEAGVGAFFDPALRDRYGVVEERHVLVDHLAELGVAPEDVDVVVLSHLHFDHAGGVLARWAPGEPARLVFPRAHYVVSRPAWNRAVSPTPRDRASYVPELQPLLEATGRLELIDGDTSETLGSGYRFHHSDGHTPGLLLTELDTDHGPVLFASDLVPGRPWLHVPITMGYDRFPELVVQEKATLLRHVADTDAWVAFPHDPEVAMARIGLDERGRYVATSTLA